MATGYTYTIEEGATFEEFVWRCAQAFVMNVTMNDKGVHVNNREDGFYAEQLEKAKAKLAKFETMTPEEQLNYGRERINGAIENIKEGLNESIAKIQKYHSMLAKVYAWQPPTEEHANLKRFMIRQINESIPTLDFYSERLDGLGQADPSNEYQEEMSRIRGDIEYYNKQMAEEKRRYDAVNDWVKALEGSVPYPTKKEDRAVPVS